MREIDMDSSIDQAIDIDQSTNIDWFMLKEKMKKFAKDLGIDAIGVASPDPFVTLKDRLERQQQLGYASGFEPTDDVELRTNPHLLFNEARSIIAIAVAYSSKLDNPPKSEEGARRGIFSRASWGSDYHTVLRDRLAKLEAWLEQEVPGVRYRSMVDTGELSDRAVAERAGIGFSGKNSFVINPELGSWIFLGEMITNLPLPPDESITDLCGTCTKCIDACPTGALVDAGQLNAQQCVSYLTQSKSLLSDEHMRKIGNRLYGCDTCQIVCPINRGKNWDHHADMRPDPELVKPLLKPLLTIGNKEFKSKYGHMSGAWRGKKPIQRNAVIALGNFKDATAIPELTEVLHKDPREVLRATAAWALGRIATLEAEAALRSALQKEQDPSTISYIEQAIEACSDQQQIE